MSPYRFDQVEKLPASLEEANLQLRAELKAAQGEVARLADERDALIRRYAKLESLAPETPRLAREVEELQASLAHLREKHESARESYAALQDAHITLQAEHEAAEEQVKALPPKKPGLLARLFGAQKEE